MTMHIIQYRTILWFNYINNRMMTTMTNFRSGSLGANIMDQNKIKHFFQSKLKSRTLLTVEIFYVILLSFF